MKPRTQTQSPRSTVAWLLAALCATTAHAGDPDRQPTDPLGQQAAAAWRQLTAVDVAAAYQLLKDNHPAALPEAHDPAFVANLERGHRQALARARAVASMDGYTATLREFSNAMGDGHIWSHPTFPGASIHWAGLITARRGATWIVADEDREAVGVDLVGARVVACDGIPVERFAGQVMHFRTAAGAEAEQVMRGGRLLLDDGNPFLKRPASCDFDQAGTPKSVALHWREASIDDLHRTHWKPTTGAAGFGVRPSHGGYWIALEELDPRAQAVIDQARAQAAAIRRADYVVVDLRGNGGGDDAYGRQLATALYGAEYVDSRLGPVAAECPSVYRASPGNIRAVASQIPVFQASGNPHAAASYATALGEMKAAAQRGRGLTGGTSCPVGASPPPTSPPPLHAPVVVLTDVGCFSSCINTVGYFTRLGAVQAGQLTGTDTHYGEVREIVLPSGLSTFSTLMSLMPDAPARIGPFVPGLPYDGDIADTAALEDWVPGQVGRLGHP